MPIQLAIVWHFHQPVYDGPGTDAPVLPWTRLHVLKDYVDMLELLSKRPELRVTVNVSPSLLEQLARLESGEAGDGPFLSRMRPPVSELSMDDRRFIVSSFLALRHDTMGADLPRLEELATLRGEHGAEGLPDSVVEQFEERDLRDLMVLHDLAWCGAVVSRDPVVERLRAKGRDFSEEDKASLLDVETRFVRGALGAFRGLHAAGHVEFSVSAYYHPILPLLCDRDSANESLPSLRLPDQAFRHPEDAVVQLRAGREAFAETFGSEPRGGWAPEGAISAAALSAMHEAGYAWTASDEGVLFGSLGERFPKGSVGDRRRAASLYRPWRLGDGPAVLFRDAELSERIGRDYAAWTPRLAADDFVRTVKRVGAAAETEDAPATVTVVLDGENAWELYPHHGRPFLEALYDRIVEASDSVRTVTASEAAAGPCRSLDRVVAGSWMRGALDTWIGHPEKNRAWELLEQTRAAVVRSRGTIRFDDPAGRAVLAAEGSDWWWWLGDDHPDPFSGAFDERFRALLATAYRACELDPPAVLDEPIGEPNDPSSDWPAGPVQPELDGRVTDFYEWLEAGRTRAYGAVDGADLLVREAFYGADGEHLFVRIDPASPPASRALARAIVHLEFAGYPDDGVAVRLGDAPGVLERSGVRVAVDRIVEIAVPLARIPGGRDTEGHRFAIRVETQGGEVQRLPTVGQLVLPEGLGRHDELDWFI